MNKKERVIFEINNTLRVISQKGKMSDENLLLSTILLGIGYMIEVR